MCTVPNTDSSMAARTEDCIVMLPTGNRTGSVKMMSISTGKLVTCDQFKILPMPSSIIIRLNDMAAAEGRKATTKSSMSYDLEGGYRKVDPADRRFSRRYSYIGLRHVRRTIHAC